MNLQGKIKNFLFFFLKSCVVRRECIEILPDRTFSKSEFKLRNSCIFVA